MTTTNKYGSMLRELLDKRTPQARQEEIFRKFDEFSDREEKYKSWLRLADNKINPALIELPFVVIFSEKLSTGHATLEVPIPESYKHLLIYGSGRTTGAGTGTENLFLRYNGDSGVNYNHQKLTVVTTSVTAARDTSQTQTLIGGLAQGGRADSDSISFVAFIPFASSPSLFKTSFSLIGPTMLLYFGNWTLNPPAPVSQISFIPGADSIAAGSVISVFGVR